MMAYSKAHEIVEIRIISKNVDKIVWVTDFEAEVILVCLKAS